MINKKRVFALLMFVLLATVRQVGYAENTANRLHMPVYQCASIAEPLQRVYVNLGGRRGFVQLDVSMANSQPVAISVLKQCLLQNGLMSKEAFAAYSQALETCRRVHYQQKAQFSRGDITTISTSKAFDFDHCLQHNLLKDTFINP